MRLELARVSRTKSRYLHFIKVMTSITIKIRAAVESFVVTKVKLKIFSENIYFAKKHENIILLLKSC